MAGRASSTVPTSRGVVDAGDLAIAYRLERSVRRKRTLELSVERDGVRVRAPMRTPIREVEAFVRARADWIRKQRVTSPVRHRLGETEVTPYLGRELPVAVHTSHRSNRSAVRLDLLGIRVDLPPGEDPAAALGAWYRERAQDVLGERVGWWSEAMGLAPKVVLVRNQRRRWASCARDRSLRFNWRLVMLAPRLIDYVVVHELSHLRHPHHQRPFWDEVERALPDYRRRRTELKAAGAILPA